MIYKKMTMFEVVMMDFAFNPWFDKPLHMLQATAL